MAGRWTKFMYKIFEFQGNRLAAAPFLRVGSLCDLTQKTELVDDSEFN